MNQVNYGIGQGAMNAARVDIDHFAQPNGTGQLTLKNLRLKKGALDKFRLPVDVLEGTERSISNPRCHTPDDLSIQDISENSRYLSTG